MTYRNLEAECARKGITKKDIALCLDVRYATVSDKMRGKYPFTLDEALKIKKNFFPNLSIEYLFNKDAEQVTAQDVG